MISYNAKQTRALDCRVVLLGFIRLRSEILVSILLVLLVWSLNRIISHFDRCNGELKMNLHVSFPIYFADITKYKSNMNDCRCQCLPHLATFREDLNICVDDIRGECFSISRSFI